MSEAIRHLKKAISAGEQVEYHRKQMGMWAGVRAKNIRRARDDDDGLSVREIADYLGVSESAVRKAIAMDVDPETGRARWQSGKGDKS